MEAVEDWKSKLQQVLSEYPPEDKFNADETGLFYRQMPRKSLIQKGEKFKGRKLFKERLSVLFCCIATGKKLKPLVTGNAARPQVFKEQCIDTKHLTVNWRFNKKAWMTQTIFEEWLTDLNCMIKKEIEKSCCLLIMQSHRGTKVMNNVTVKFLPPNLTSEVQPLDQGIIQSAKAHYRNMMLQYIVSCRS
jgi:hypothetical protein